MRKPTSSDLKEMGLLKHYRIIRKWACKTCNIKDADLELIIYLESIDYFRKQDFKDGVRFKPLNSDTYKTDDVQHSLDFPFEHLKNTYFDV